MLRDTSAYVAADGATGLGLETLEGAEPIPIGALSLEALEAALPHDCVRYMSIVLQKSAFNFVLKMAQNTR